MTPRPIPKYLGLGPRVHGAHRHHEAQAVGGGHLTTAPGARQGDPGLRRDEARVRRAQGLVAQVILADPGQAIAPQALSLVAHEWLEAGVAGFRQQHGADADAKIRDPRRAFADVRKRDGEICTRRDLEQDLRQIDTGQPSRDGGP